MRALAGRSAAVVAGVAALLAGWLPAGGSASAAVTHDLIQGSGSSWSSNAVNQWVADVQPSGLKVVYTPSGSAQGRKDFAYRNVDYAVSDIGYQGQDAVTGDQDTALGRPFAYLPIVAGGTAFPYQVRVGGQLKRNIRLSGQTLAKIFTNQITDWSDPQITADNNGHKLPSLPIIPVVHSEGSGSTAQFTRYLDSMYPNIWRPYLGKAGVTEYFPRKDPQIGQNGSDGVMNFISSSAANGAIGYDEYSYALAKNYPVAKVENSAGYFTLPNQYNVAVALTQAQINQDKSSPDYLLQNLENVYRYGDIRTYPLSSYSYAIIPTGTTAQDPKITTAKRQTLADFLYYSVCAGQKEMGPIGYSPLPLNLVQASFDQTAKLQAADPAVQISTHDVRSCNNPTFDPANPGRNYLAEIAPNPAACDKAGQGPCVYTADAGISNPGTSGAPAAPGGGSSAAAGAANSGSSAGASSGAASGPNGGAATASARASAAGSKRTTIDPVTGQIVDASAANAAASDVTGTSTDLAAYNRLSDNLFYAALAALMLLLAVVLPPFVARRLSGRKSA